MKIVTIKAPEAVVELTRLNLRAAASAALLLLPEVFPAVDLFMVCGVRCLCLRTGFLRACVGHTWADMGWCFPCLRP